MNFNELLLVLGATGRVLRDSDRIDDIHLVADITSRERFRTLLARSATSPRADILVRQPEINDDTVDFGHLAALPADTLGGAFARHLQRHALEIYTKPTSDRFIDDPDIRYLVHRYRQTHDIWHVLVGLGTQGHEEVLLHGFIYGQLRLPVSALILLFGTAKHIIAERRWGALRHGLRAAYRSGRAASPLLLVEWESRWEQPLPELRQELGIVPLSESFA